jgi:hypothetical protein
VRNRVCAGAVPRAAFVAASHTARRFILRSGDEERIVVADQSFIEKSEVLRDLPALLPCNYPRMSHRLLRGSVSETLKPVSACLFASPV